MKYLIWTLFALVVPAIALMFRTGHSTIGDQGEVVFGMLGGFLVYGLGLLVLRWWDRPRRP